MKTIYLFLLFALSAPLSIAQSISGNLAMAETDVSLGYGNVDVYKGDELVASVLTDELGNFNVALDTGTYVCVVNYAGFKEVKKTIHVDKDVVNDFSIEADPTKPRLVPPKKNIAVGSLSTMATRSRDESREAESALSEDTYVTEEKIMERYRSFGYIDSKKIVSDGETYEWEGLEDIPEEGRKGALTAGEINDFSKWDLWKDLSQNELKSYQAGWELAPTGRFTIQLQSSAGLPLADALVKLLSHGGNVLYASRTDNTGKAELWRGMKHGTEEDAGRVSIEVIYQGIRKTLEDVTPFSESINHLMLDVECKEINNVDIAFVVDATGSMGDELNYLKAEMNDIIYQSKQISDKLNFRFANVFYRDEGNGEEYLTNTMDFNRILSESVNFINQQSAGGGGDYEEAVEIALDTAIHSLSWSEEARTRVIFLILDAPPHNNEKNRAKLQTLITDAAKKGIRIVPVGASGINKATEYLMRTMALGTNGTYTFLTDHSGIGNGHIEPTTDEYKVETFNDILVRILKSYTYMADCEQNIPELDLDYPDSIVSTVNPVNNDSLLANSDDSLAFNDGRDSLLVNHNDSINDRDSLHQIDHSTDVRTITWTYYPNPTNGIVNIKSEVKIEELYISDLSGKVLQIIKNIDSDRVVQVDLSAYVTGIYLIRYPYEDRWLSGKVVLHR